MYKYVIIVSFFIAILIPSENLEHSMNSSINSFTKTPDEGRMFINLGLSNNKFSSIYNANGKKIRLSNSTQYKYSHVSVDATYHGTKGAGYNMQVSFLKADYNDSVRDFDQTSYAFGAYFVWNEMFQRLNPAVMNGYQYTFPTTRIINGVRLIAKEVGSTSYVAVGATFAMDFIIGSKCILSNRLNADLMDDDNIHLSVLSSKVIYDFNKNYSFGTSFNYLVNNNGDHLAVLSLEGGYQFNNLQYGNFNSTIQINPYFEMTLFGENMLIEENKFGLNLNVLFN